MKFTLTIIFLSILSTFAQDASDLTPANIRKNLIPYLSVLEKDEVHLKKEKDKIDLGRVLFYDKRLTVNSDISCNSCHDLKNYGTNGELYKKQREEGTTYRDVPSIYNLGKFILFNWDGSHKTLEGQTASALKNKHEMNIESSEEMIKRLKAISGYSDLFKKAFPDEEDAITEGNLVKALTEFQRGLVTIAPIDKFLKGDDKALTEKQLKGAYLFDQKSCFACHTGANFGGQMVIKLGITQPWPNQEDTGYYKVSGDPKHKMTFRVSPLRNISKTAPYFHDASSKRMWDAIRKMSQYELGQIISVDEVLMIQEFFKCLTGEIPEKYIEKPKMP